MNTSVNFWLRKIIIAISFICLGFIFAFYFKDYKYKKIEEKMINLFKNYVKDNHYNVDEMSFLAIDKIDLTLKNCNSKSGVLIKSENEVLSFEPYLICDNYLSSNLKSSSRYIKLLGDNPYIVSDDTAFVDPGYENYGYTVEETSNYQNSPGVYKIDYHVFDNGKKKETVTRTIIVSDNFSNEKPILTLNGEESLHIKVNGTYIEPGYIAFDYVDGDITNRVKVSNNLDLSKEGNYEISYEVINDRGLATIKKRLINVSNETNDLVVNLIPNDFTSNFVAINITNLKSNYAYTIKPDNSKTTDRTFSYEVAENGKYTFKVYDESGLFYEKSVLVENIDKIYPTGKCKITTENDYVTYEVIASDNNKIKGYSYYNGFSYSDYTTSFKAKYLMDYQNASVLIADLAGNITKINCEKA